MTVTDAVGERAVKIWTLGIDYPAIRAQSLNVEKGQSWRDFEKNEYKPRERQGA